MRLVSEMTVGFTSMRLFHQPSKQSVNNKVYFIFVYISVLGTPLPDNIILVSLVYDHEMQYADTRGLRCSTRSQRKLQQMQFIFI